MQSHLLFLIKLLSLEGECFLVPCYDFSHCISLYVSTYDYFTELWVLSHFAGAEIGHDGVGHDDN